MEVLRLVTVAIAGVSLTLLVRQHRPDLALLIAAACALCLCMWSMAALSHVLNASRRIVELSGADREYVLIMLRAIGISYIVRFASDICSDAGQSAIAHHIDTAGRLLILICAMPLFYAAVDILGALASGGA